MTEIYLSENHLMLQSGYENPEMHSHSACHILIGLRGGMEIILEKEKVKCHGALIPSGMAHTVHNFNMPMLVFLFDNTTTVSQQIQNFQALDKETVQRIVFAYEKYHNGSSLQDDYKNYLSSVMIQLGMSEIGSKIIDERIISAMHFVEEHISENICVKDAAKTAFLSIGRFSHLFKQQAGITFAGYVILRRLYHTYIELSKGTSITDAALMTGFSSPAHFATVNKKLFGITARDISGNFLLHKIAEI